MNKITPIRADMNVVVHLNEANSYFQETRECRRYEDNLCRICDNMRLNLSPWCYEHFPWRDQKPQSLPQPQELRGL